MKKLKIGIVGLHFGRHIVENEIAKGPGTPYFDLAAVCSQERERTDAMASKHGCKAYHDLDALLADEDIGCIGLFCGPVGRANLIRNIIRAGKDVMTTKPFELDPVIAREVLEEAKSLKRIVHLNSPSPLFSGEIRQIRHWQQELNLGRVIACRADTWARYDEKPDGSWYDDPALCPVPPVFRLGIYLINDLVRLIGPADKVAVVSSRIFTGRPTSDNGQLSISFTGGAIANIFASFCVRDGEHYKNSLVLNFENGTIYRNAGPLPDELPVGSSHVEVVAWRGERKHVERAFVEGASGMYQWDIFARAVMGETFPDEVSTDQIVDGIKIVRAMARAEAEGSVVSI